MRLDKLLVDRGVGARTRVRQLVRKGAVTVQGVLVRDPGLAVDPDAVVTVGGRTVARPPDLAVLHKPAGVHSTVGDPMGRANLADVAEELLEMGLHPVGRLDHDSTGLLPFVRDGAITQRLLHPRHEVEKEYVATVENPVPAGLGAILAAGVRTGDGVHVAQLVGVDGQQVRLIVREGKHRMVRRMLNNVGLPVVALHRVRFGALELGDLPAGEWRPGTTDELAWCVALLG